VKLGGPGALKKSRAPYTSRKRRGVWRTAEMRRLKGQGNEDGSARRNGIGARLQGCQGLFDPRDEKDSCGVGFIADIKGRKSHQIVEDALTILLNLEHRGAVGADPRAGDGAGILVQIPHKFFAKKTKQLGFALPAARRVRDRLSLFCRASRKWRQVIIDIYAEVIAEEGMKLLGWRDVPTDNSTLGESVKPTEPVHVQVFIGRRRKHKDEDEFERRLYFLRKVISNRIYNKRERRLADFYAVSMSCRTVVYKGMFLADQLGAYYPDLHDPRFRKRARARAPALFDQHLPDLVARASLPHGRP
jgi:glutamate synthase (NADPH/NADH) large chain